MSAVLAVAEFRALWFAEAQSVFGDQLAKVALTILVYDRTNSPLFAALVYALTYLSALAGGLGLSQLADRFPRRPLMVTCTAAQAVLVGLMAIPDMPIPVLCGLVLCVGLVAGAGARRAERGDPRDLHRRRALPAQPGPARHHHQHAHAARPRRRRHAGRRHRHDLGAVDQRGDVPDQRRRGAPLPARTGRRPAARRTAGSAPRGGCSATAACGCC